MINTYMPKSDVKKKHRRHKEEEMQREHRSKYQRKARPIILSVQFASRQPLALKYFVCLAALARVVKSIGHKDLYRV
jgi:hypothetical protein